jgi:hypothetical protein
VPPTLTLVVQTEEPWQAIAETILQRKWSQAEAEDWPQTQRWEESRVWVGDSRPMSWDPVLTDLGIDYRVKAVFIYNKERLLYDQTSSALRAAARVHAAHGGAGALHFQGDDVLLRWTDERLVVNELSSFKDQAVEVLGPGVDVEPIPWE